MVVRLSALRAGRLYPQEIFLNKHTETYFTFHYVGGYDHPPPKKKIVILPYASNLLPAVNPFSPSYNKRETSDVSSCLCIG